MSVTKRGFQFSQHAMEQMLIRLGHTFDIDTRMELVNSTYEVSNEEAYEIVGDPTIMNSKNKRKTKYYVADVEEDCIRQIVEGNGYSVDELDGVIMVFVVRDNCCVTFKTNTETAIYSNIRVFETSKRYNREKLQPDCIYYAKEEW